MRTDLEIAQIIDETISSIWVNEIRNDYESVRLLKEDTLKNAMYYHLRKRLDWLFDECNVRLFTEFTDWKFKHTRKIPDMVIAKVNMESNASYWGDAVTDCFAVIELKYKNSFAASKDIYDDYEKLRFYIEELGVKCKLYMGTIWEQEDDEVSWEEMDAGWAKGKVTELNASLSWDNGKPQFYVVKH